MVIRDKPLSSIKADIVHAFLSVSLLFLLCRRTRTTSWLTAVSWAWPRPSGRSPV